MDVSDSNIATLKKFLKQTEKLLNSNLIKLNKSLELNFSFDGSGLITKVTQFDEDQLSSLLIAFRPMISKDEDIFLPKIYHLIELNSTNPELKEMGRNIRKLEKEALKNSPISLTVDNTKYSDEKIYDLISNSEYFHLDDQKSREIEKIPLDGKEILRYKFMNYIILEITVIVNLKQAVTLLLKEIEGSDPFTLN